MTVDQSRRDPAAVAIGASPCIERGGRIRCRSGIDDAAIGGGDHPILDQAKALARRRQRCKTAAVPDVIDRCHEPWGSSANAMRLRIVYLSIHIIECTTCPALRGGDGDKEWRDCFSIERCCRRAGRAMSGSVSTPDVSSALGPTWLLRPETSVTGSGFPAFRICTATRSSAAWLASLSSEAAPPATSGPGAT